MCDEEREIMVKKEIMIKREMKMKDDVMCDEERADEGRRKR